MIQSEGQPNENLQFCWGKKRGIGGAKKDIQFYESFVFDNVNYSLYDSVYLFEHGDPEPYVGKIVKIWEQADHKKKVKVLWFFHPNEIHLHLGDHALVKKEVFLASGEGAGLADINPLEALAGKCYVICTSKDERNPQPYNEELAMADYIFYRVFDVGSCTISEKIPDRIAGIEVKSLLNRKGDQMPILLPKIEVNGTDQHGRVVSGSPRSRAKSKSDASRSLDNGGADEKPGCLLTDGTGSVKEESLNKVVVHRVDNAKPAENKSDSSLSSERPAKKMRPSDDLVLATEDLLNGAGVKKPIVGSADDPLANSKQLHRLPSEPKILEEPLKKAVTDTVQENEKKVDHRTVEGTNRPDADRRKWFKQLPWETRMQNADEHGTLVYMQNLDPSLTSSQIEDIIYDALKLTCCVRIMKHPTYGDPNNGQAYAIFKTREAADQAVSNINTRCLMVSEDGRPLICSKGLLKIPKASSFNGHLSIDKLKIQMREEMKKAVSTSHCSQPNTIEYDMAMDWLLIQEKFDRALRGLHKRHSEELKQLKRRSSSK